MSKVEYDYCLKCGTISGVKINGIRYPKQCRCKAAGGEWVPDEEMIEQIKGGFEDAAEDQDQEDLPLT